MPRAPDRLPRPRQRDRFDDDVDASSWRPRASAPASSGSSSRAGTSRRRSARSSSSRRRRLARRRGRRPSPRRGEGRRRRLGARSGPGRQTSGSSRSARRGWTRTGMFSPWDAQLANLRRNLALALADGQARDPPLPVGGRRARRPGRARSRELRAAGFGGEASRGGVRGPAAGGDPLASPGRSTTPARCWTSGSRSRSPGLVFRRGEEASADVVPLVPAERLLVETDSPFLSPPGAPARPQRARARSAITAELGRRAARRRRRTSSATASSPRTTPRSRGARRGRLVTGAGSIAPPPHRCAARRSAPLRLDRDYRLLWAGQAISVDRPDDHPGRRCPYQVYVLTHDLLASVPVARPAHPDPRLRPRRRRRRRRGRPATAPARHAGGARARDSGARRVALVPAPPLAACTSLAFIRPASVGGPAGPRERRSRASSTRATAERAISLNQACSTRARSSGRPSAGSSSRPSGSPRRTPSTPSSYVAAIARCCSCTPIPPSPGAARPSIRASPRAAVRRRRRPDPRDVRRRPQWRWSSGRRARCSRRSPSTCSRSARRASGFWPRRRRSARWSRRCSRAGRRASGDPGRAVLDRRHGLGPRDRRRSGCSTFSFPLALLFLALASGADVISAVLRGFIVQALTPDSSAAA